MLTLRTPARHLGQFGISIRLRYRMDRFSSITIEQVNREEKKALVQSAVDQVFDRLKRERQLEKDDKIPVPWWGKILFSAIAFILVGGSAEILRVENKSSGYDVKIGDIDTDVKTLSGKVDNLPQKISSALISKAKTAADDKDFVASARALELSNTLLKIAANDRLKARPEFFSDTVHDLDSIEKEASLPTTMAMPLHAARVVLAEYRASVTPLPTVQIHGQLMTPLESDEVAHALGYKSILRSPLGSKSVWFVPNPHFVFSGAPASVSNIALLNGAQTLDQHIRWNHVLFVNTKIIYHGGPLYLSDVIFVNCSFDVTSDSPDSARFLEAAALGQQSITIG